MLYIKFVNESYLYTLITDMQPLPSDMASCGIPSISAADVTLIYENDLLIN
jgi:hypothetical protein